MAFQQELLAHLQSGATTVARAWGIVRKDGVRLGFTDHDRDLSFEGFEFRASTGLTASALEQGTGLAVDNSEAVGVLSDASVRSEDIAAGRLDGAEVICWLVNWAQTSERSVLFRGALGELRQAGGAFVAELRGLSERLNMPRGRVYQRACSAVLGDMRCGIDVRDPAFSVEATLVSQADRRVFRFDDLENFAAGWFTHGQLRVLSGESLGLTGLIKRDVSEPDSRVIELWEALPLDVMAGDQLRLIAGCDKRFSTCGAKFDNRLNFQGFPDIPGEDWITSYPTKTGNNSGGSLR
ncbi:DUF2163 domain-containing protein [Shimia sp. R10_1]|uniref:DUF2163 domain-containing protein n=1 Tax=Shimia sp. R10_1 TaxID=2821095 RepID=UPI001AD9B6C7|nr:DUF2163 domain-containing protein [Shimia sp. R10_1]MBO9472027.1 DUF2163 domain-containing protein [Shimia sp. R10_1]